MSVEPSAAYTVLRRPLLPPKPAPKPMAMPALSMVEEAKQVRERFNRQNGRYCFTEEPNRARQEEAIARQEALIVQITDLLRKHGQMFPIDMMDITGAAPWPMCHAINRMEKDGTIVRGQHLKRGWLWSLA